MDRLRLELAEQESVMRMGFLGTLLTVLALAGGAPAQRTSSFRSPPSSASDSTDAVDTGIIVVSPTGTQTSPSATPSASPQTPSASATPPTSSQAPASAVPSAPAAKPSGGLFRFLTGQPAGGSTGTSPVKPVAAEQRLPDAADAKKPAETPKAAVTSTVEAGPLVPPAAGTPLWSDECPICTEECGCLKKCYPNGYTWVSVDYLLWFLRGQPTPPLVTTGPANVPPGSLGTLGSPGTAVLFGNNGVDYGTVSGLRVMTGVQAADHLVGLEFGAFLLEQSSTGIGVASDANGTPVLARPFTDAVTGQASRVLTSAPGAFAGALTASSSNRFWGGEANVTRAVFGLLGDDSSLEIDALAGFRYLDLAESIDINQQSTILANGIGHFDGAFLFSPTRVGVADSFSTRNNFYGSQFGTEVEFQYCHIYGLVTTKVAFGVTREALDVNGVTTAQPVNGPLMTTPGGLLALPSNIGRRTRDVFSVVPEVDLNLGYQINRNFRVYAGYSFIDWDNVSRPGSQLSSTVSTQQLPTSAAFGPLVGPAQPASVLRRTDFWAHGVNLGLAVHF
jgi:hypothetical protein